MYDTGTRIVMTKGAALAKHPHPTVRRRKVGSELKRLRLAAGVTMEEAAERIGGDKPKISRQENGRQGVTKLEAEALLELYHVEDLRLRTALITMARESRRKGWWAQHGDLLAESLQEQISIESDAARILLFQPLTIPGLLQTREYAEESIRSVEKSRGASAEQIATYVSVRMDRQEILRGESAPQVVCLLDEAVLHRSMGGPAVMAAQLQRLIDVNHPPQLSIQVIPFEQGWHAGLDGAFSIFSYPDPMDLDVVSLGYLDGALYLEENGPVERYRMAFDQLRSSALSSQQSMALIARVARSQYAS
ncbi:helix-turn-helix domain-containing protein [Streptomyces sp. NPDC021020]|uniref:helix-turn-helix domain-containing protein n=1 Tax=Streptomyces sp. NPDC021020 TaxID=3365109 RepID=UPI0037A84361